MGEHQEQYNKGSDQESLVRKKGSDFHFWPWWSKRVNMMFTLPSGTRQKQTKYMKQQIARHWT